jgi:hypothetical protein
VCGTGEMNFYAKANIFVSSFAKLASTPRSPAFVRNAAKKRRNVNLRRQSGTRCRDAGCACNVLETESVACVRLLAAPANSHPTNGASRTANASAKSALQNDAASVGKQK